MNWCVLFVCRWMFYSDAMCLYVGFLVCCAWMQSMHNVSTLDGGHLGYFFVVIFFESCNDNDISFLGLTFVFCKLWRKWLVVLRRRTTLNIKGWYIIEKNIKLDWSSWTFLFWIFLCLLMRKMLMAIVFITLLLILPRLLLHWGF